MKDWLMNLWVKAWFESYMDDVRCPVPKAWRWRAVWALVVVGVVLVVVWP